VAVFHKPGNIQYDTVEGPRIKKQKNEAKSFAQMMIKDHREAEQRLLALAKRQHINRSPSATGDVKPDLLLAGLQTLIRLMYTPCPPAMAIPCKSSRTMRLTAKTRRSKPGRSKG
jgi:hypothetical protein